jgi:hypothetical protein
VTGAPERPDLSVVVVTRDSYRTLRPIVASLACQTVASRIELLVVAPDDAAGAIPANDAASFHSCRVVPAGPVANRGRAAAAGAVSAQGSIVALTENHCFPVRDWAERTLEAHAAGWAGVGPSIVNANPSSAFSRVLHAAGYGGFPADGQPEEREELPLHNSSYRMDVLSTYRAELGDLLADERRLQRALRRDGHALYFFPRACKRHINEATLGQLVGLAFDGGRRYAGVRARDWSRWRRAAYGLLSPALAVPIASHLRGKLGDGGSGSGPARAALVAWMWALTHALGEGAAYLSGEADEFPYTEEDEFLIRERLGRHGVGDPEIGAWLALLD